MNGQTVKGNYLGEVRDGLLIGKTSYPEHHIFYIWSACCKCGKTRWVARADIKRGARSKMCLSCYRKIVMTRHGSAHPLWQGRWKHDGYIILRIQPDDAYYAMSNRGAVSEHRYVMAQYRGRCLLPIEQVHHRNGIRDDNRIENLELMPNAAKHNETMACANCELRKEIRLLHWELKQMREALQLKLGD